MGVHFPEGKLLGVKLLGVGARRNSLRDKFQEAVLLGVILREVNFQVAIL